MTSMQDNQCICDRLDTLTLRVDELVQSVKRIAEGIEAAFVPRTQMIHPDAGKPEFEATRARIRKT